MRHAYTDNHTIGFEIKTVYRGDVEYGDDWEERTNLVEVASVREAATFKDLGDAVRKEYNTYCTHSYDCCANWYARANIVPFGNTGLFALTIHSYLNI